jgi:hypothetical protein
VLHWHTFVTSVIVDPDDHRMVWAGVEIDGVFRSLDGGNTWRRLNHDPLDLIEVDLALPPLSCRMLRKVAGQQLLR